MSSCHANRRWYRAFPLPFFAAASLTARAQCPDGSPPPCRSVTATTDSRVGIRLAPPSDPRAWIVAPFTNATRSNDLAWLTGASVNLLPLGLGRWTDIKVIDDKHVGDLMRKFPAAKGTRALTLND